MSDAASAPPPPQIIEDANISTAVARYKDLYQVLLKIKTSNYPIERGSIHACISLDISGSMYGSRIKICRAVLLALCDILGEEDTFTIVIFGDYPTHLFTWKMTEQNKEASRSEIRGISVSGSTNISASFLNPGMCLDQLVQNPESKNICILITDGFPNKGIQDGDQLSQAISEKIGDFEYSLFSLGIGGSHNAEFLTSLSEYHFIYHPSEVPNTLGLLLGEAIAPVVGKDPKLSLIYPDINTKEGHIYPSTIESSYQPNITKMQLSNFLNDSRLPLLVNFSDIHQNKVVKFVLEYHDTISDTFKRIESVITLTEDPENKREVIEMYYWFQWETLLKSNQVDQMRLMRDEINSLDSLFKEGQLVLDIIGFLDQHISDSETGSASFGLRQSSAPPLLRAYTTGVSQGFADRMCSSATTIGEDLDDLGVSDDEESQAPMPPSGMLRQRSCSIVSSALYPGASAMASDDEML